VYLLHPLYTLHSVTAETGGRGLISAIRTQGQVQAVRPMHVTLLKGGTQYSGIAVLLPEPLQTVLKGYKLR